MTDSPRLLRPKPRRPFELPSNESSRPPSPPNANTANANSNSSATTDLLDVKSDLDGKRTGSLLNLTSSTLLGIFQQTAFDSGRDENSPWDTQVHTPIETDVNNRFPSAAVGGAKQLEQIQPQHQHARQTVGALLMPLIAKTSLLFVCGVVYGTIMAHLHENNWITPVKLELIDRNSYVYLAAWGFGGVSLAYVLPWLDNLWENASPQKKPFANGYQKVGNATSGDSRSSRWTLAVRSIGAFVGIAFAMRRLPWESTTQESLTLALVNPFLWYLIDRTKTGFWLSTVVALTGMGITLALHPEILPSSATGGLGLRNGRLALDIQGGLSQEATAVAIWLASAFYSACVCFGNIGRQLALGGNQQEAAR